MAAPEAGPSQIVVHALVQATEDEEKVLVAIRHLFPETAWSHLHVVCTAMLGHFHNPILQLVVALDQCDLLMDALRHLGAGLSGEDRSYLQHNLSSHYDGKGQLFLRFDKQECYRGRLRLLSRGDSLRITIKLAGRRRTLEAALELCRQCGLL
jgi:RNA binding exosome subunit